MNLCESLKLICCVIQSIAEAQGLVIFIYLDIWKYLTGDSRQLKNCTCASMQCKNNGCAHYKAEVFFPSRCHASLKCNNKWLFLFVDSSEISW